MHAAWGLSSLAVKLIAVTVQGAGGRDPVGTIRMPPVSLVCIPTGLPGGRTAGRMPQTPGDPGRVRTSARDHPAGRIRQAAGPGNAAAEPAAVVSWLAGRRRMRLPRTSAPYPGITLSDVGD